MSPGPTQIIVILLVAALLFGGRRLSSLGKDLGGGLRAFKDGLTGARADEAPSQSPDGSKAQPKRSPE